MKSDFFSFYTKSIFIFFFLLSTISNAEKYDYFSFNDAYKIAFVEASKSISTPKLVAFFAFDSQRKFGYDCQIILDGDNIGLSNN